MATKFKTLFAVAFLSCLAFLYFEDSIRNSVFTERSSHRQKESFINSSQNLPNLTSLSRYIHFNVKTDKTECGKRHYIVYTCSQACGGWGDRLKGITSVFLLAQLTNRTLLIDMQTPCDLRNFVIPNMYDWNECLPTTKRLDKNKIFQLKFVDSLKSLHLNDFVSGKLSNYQVIRIQINSMVFELIRKHPLTNSTMPWFHTLTIAEITGSVLGILFKPTRNITQKVEQFYKDKVGNKKLVCGHVRYGKNPSIPNDARFPDGGLRVSSVLKFLQRYVTEKTVIFVATDSDNVRSQSKNLFSNYISTDRHITHIERTRIEKNEACEGFMTAVLENVLLSTCDVLVLTYSGFGAMAAYMRGDSNDIYLHLTGKTDIVNCTLSGIQEINKFV